MLSLYSINFALNAIGINSYLHVYTCISLHRNSLNERHGSFWKPIHANLRMETDRFLLRSIENL